MTMQKRFSPMSEDLENKLTSYIEDIRTPVKNQKYIRHGARWAHSTLSSQMLVQAIEINKLQSALLPFANMKMIPGSPMNEHIVAARLLLKL